MSSKMEVIPEEPQEDDVVMGPPPLPRRISERRFARGKRTYTQTQVPTSSTVNENVEPSNGTPSKQPSNTIENQAASSAPNANTLMLPREAESTERRRVIIQFDRLVFVRVLGEGAFGEVVLMMDRDDSTIAVAVKKISLIRTKPEDRLAVKKEALIQRALRGHQNILKYYNMQTHNDVFELYLEYADGGELFDQIEPDVGMEPPRAQFFFRQLMCGVEHLHLKGVVHRDLKPENLLVTKRHCLKICDFGMATVFRSEGRERLLNTRCGTVAYSAPEVSTGTQYRGPPVDIWSCGIVLITMLVGELPWEEPHPSCPKFYNFFQKKDVSKRPWSRFDTNELSILTMILNYLPLRRPAIQRITNHPWFVGNLFHQTNMRRPIPSDSGVRVNINQKKPAAPTSSSQPATMRHLASPVIPTTSDSQYLTVSSVSMPAAQKVSFSQPVNVDSMLLNKSQLSSSQIVSRFAHPHATLVRRMTRFCVTVDVPAALDAVESAANNLNCRWHCTTNHQLYITCLTSEDLSFIATVYEMIDDGHEKVLIDFRRSRGDGIEFKRRFIEFKNALSSIISRDSVDWLEKKGLVCTQKAEAIIAESQDQEVDLLGAADESPSTEKEPARRHTDIEMQA